MEAAAVVAVVTVTKVIMATVVLAVIVTPVLMVIALMITITKKMMKMIKKRTLRVLMITQVMMMMMGYHGNTKQLGDCVWSESAPNIARAMSQILAKVRSTLTRGWLGLSIVHLGDRDVPNAFFFIDKYSQVPRILGPLTATVECINTLTADLHSSVCGGVWRAQKSKALHPQRLLQTRA